MFFWPYVGATRLRYEILFLFLMSAVSVVVLLKTGRIMSGMEMPILISLVILAYSAAFLFSRQSQTLFASAMAFVNINFMSLSILASYPMRRWLARNIHSLMRILLLVSIPINLYALFQMVDSRNSFHDRVFALYGGTVNEYLSGLGATTWAEGMVRYAGRGTSIFNVMHSLGLFNVMIGVLSLRLWLRRTHGQNRIISPLWAIVVLACSVIGGFCSASKSYFATMALAMLIIIWQNRTNLRLIPPGLCGVGLFLGLVWFFSANPVIQRMAFNSYSLEYVLYSRYGWGAEEGHLSSTINHILTSPEALCLGVDTSDPRIKASDCLYTLPVLIGGLGFFLLYLGQVLQVGFLSSNRRGQEKNPFRLILVLFLCTGVGQQTLMLGRITALMMFFLLGFYYHNRMHVQDVGHGFLPASCGGVTASD